MNEDKNISCVINKTIKKIGISGNCYEFKNVIVQGLTMEETKKVFDEEWNESKDNIIKEDNNEKANEVSDEL